MNLETQKAIDEFHASLRSLIMKVEEINKNSGLVLDVLREVLNKL